MTSVFDAAFGLPQMCGESDCDLRAGHADVQHLCSKGRRPRCQRQRPATAGSRARPPGPLEVVLDVEWAHAIAPGANILLVHTPTAETLGMQGFPQMMKAEDYVVKNHPRR